MSRSVRTSSSRLGAPERALSQSVAPRARPHVPALDAIRGVAILSVMIFHMSMVPPVGVAALAWLGVARFGASGVDIFFVLSGFLITGILLDARGGQHFFRNFYARRALRIFPLYYAVAAFSFLILPRVAPWTVVKFGEVNRDAVWYWFHLSNFAIARRGAFVHGIMDVSWSLAIEEQFYLVWPAVVFAVTSARKLRLICVALILISCASRALLTIFGVNPVAVYTLTFCRLDGLALGALLASACRTLPLASMRAWLLGGGVFTAGLFVLVLVPGPPMLSAVRNAAFDHLLISSLAACAVLAVAVSPDVSGRVLGFTPLQALGRYSFALYLFHYPISAAIRDRLVRPADMPQLGGSSLPSQLFFYAIAGAATFAAALLSWHLFEKRCLRLRRHFQ